MFHLHAAHSRSEETLVKVKELEVVKPTRWGWAG